MKQNMAHKLLSSLQMVPRSACFTSCSFLLFVWYLILQPCTCCYLQVHKLTQLTHLNSTTVAPNITQELESHNTSSSSQKWEILLLQLCRNFMWATKCHLHAIHLCRTHHQAPHGLFLLFLSFDGVFCCCLHRFLLFSPALHANWVVVISFFSWCLVCWLHHGWNGPG